MSKKYTGSDTENTRMQINLVGSKIWWRMIAAGDFQAPNQN